MLLLRMILGVFAPFFTSHIAFPYCRRLHLHWIDTEHSRHNVALEDALVRSITDRHVFGLCRTGGHNVLHMGCP